MVYEKKLIILSGAGSAKGTVSIERSAYGTFVTLNAYNVPDLTSGEYYMGIREQDKTYTRNLGSLGRIATRYKLADISLGAVHCFLYDDSLAKIVMYGTNCAKRIWESNLLDGVRGIINENKTLAPQAAPQISAADGMPQFSKRKEIGDYFFDIIPPEGGYLDSAIAEVNYYTSNLSYKQTADKTAAAESVASVQNATTQSVNVKNANAEKRPLPCELERRYLYRYHPENRVDSVLSFAQPTTQPTTQPTAKTQQKSQGANDITIAPPNAFTTAQAVSTPCGKASFYQQTAQQIDQLFATNPRNEKLEKLLPNTKFISVDFDKSGKYYVVGVIGAKPDYLCYGVPGKYSPTPPQELEGYCAFLPLDQAQPYGDGFWLMFQDAETGESVEKEKI